MGLTLQSKMMAVSFYAADDESGGGNVA